LTLGTTAERMDKAWNTLSVEPMVANVCLSSAAYEAETLVLVFPLYIWSVTRKCSIRDQRLGVWLN
jgi:hypothetical protein